jgi:hypothetical protein
MVESSVRIDLPASAGRQRPLRYPPKLRGDSTAPDGVAPGEARLQARGGATRHLGCDDASPLMPDLQIAALSEAGVLMGEPMRSSTPISS